jgi:pimeloyl-ACP methyl ester carboxylesterase
MLAVTASLPDRQTQNWPIVLIHGAANSALVWTYWQRELAGRGYASYAIDLRGHGLSTPRDLSRTSMRDYCEDAAQLMDQLGSPNFPPIVMGWSMGGLIAMVQARYEAMACIALAPSTPSEVRDTSVGLREGEFGAEEYGITSDNPREQPAMPDLDFDERVIALASLGRESRYARDERAAGVVVESLSCPLLVVTGSADAQWPRSRYDGMHLEADHVEVEGASHWGLVLSRRALAAAVPAVVEWLAKGVE